MDNLEKGVKKLKLKPTATGSSNFFDKCERFEKEIKIMSEEEVLFMVSECNRLNDKNSRVIVDPRDVAGK